MDFLCMKIASVVRLFLFKSVNPIGEEVIHQVNHRADEPRERIDPEEKNDAVREMHSDRDYRYPQNAPNRQHDKHRYECFSRSPADRRNAMGEGEQTEEKRFYAALQYTNLNGFRLVHERRNHRSCENEYGQSDHFRHQYGCEDAEASALPCAFILLRA